MSRGLIVYVSLMLFLMMGNALLAQEGDARKLLEEAKSFMAKGDYGTADAKFRQMLSLNEVIPANALYFFALTLEKRHQLQSSKNFLNKYFELTGKSGEYFNEARILQSQLEKKSKEIDACGFCDADGFRLVACHVCDGSGKHDDRCSLCHGFGQITCQKCLGEGVQISKTTFGEFTYKTCDQCTGSGKITCTKCKGAKHLIQECGNCFGRGKIGSSIVCTHQEEPLPITIKPGSN